jgi:hypothetical protein
MKTHTTRDGKEIKLCDMSDSHLEATIKMIERKAKEGLLICMGGGGPDAEDMWYDEETIYGDEVLEYFEYSEYIKERNRRIPN